MEFAPIARILLRYGVGYLLGSEIGETLALDQDVVMYAALGIGTATEAAYTLAVRKGWAK